MMAIIIFFRRYTRSKSETDGSHFVYIDDANIVYLYISSIAALFFADIRISLSRLEDQPHDDQL